MVGKARSKSKSKASTSVSGSDDWMSPVVTPAEGAGGKGNKQKKKKGKGGKAKESKKTKSSRKSSRASKKSQKTSKTKSGRSPAGKKKEKSRSKKSKKSKKTKSSKSTGGKTPKSKKRSRSQSLSQSQSPDRVSGSGTGTTTGTGSVQNSAPDSKGSKKKKKGSLICGSKKKSKTKSQKSSKSRSKKSGKTPKSCSVKKKGKSKKDKAHSKKGKKQRKGESKPSSTASSETEGEELPMLCSHWPRAVDKEECNRLIAVIRSAERVDRVFGSDWSRTEAPLGHLAPTDLNIPNNATSKNFLDQGVYNDNPPITAFGKYTIQLTARAMSNRGLKSKRIVCSPALRSIQTADGLAKFLKAQIVIEPGLLEPLAWYRAASKKMPEFHLEEMAKLYPIDTSYSPAYALDTLKKNFEKESEKEGIDRAEFVLRTLSQEQRNDSLIIVGHGVTLAVAASLGTSYSFVDKMEGDVVDTVSIGTRFPPGSVVALYLDSNDGETTSFEVCPFIVPPLSYGEQYSNRPALVSA